MENREFCDVMRIVFDTLASTVQSKTGKDGRDYLISCFNWDNDLYCQFVGFARVEAKTAPIPASAMVEMFVEIAMAGLSIGWHNGYETGKRTCGRA